MSKRHEIAEKTAEAFASAYLNDILGHDVFLSSHIEQLLKNKLHVIYQFVEDDSFYGATIRHESGEEFVILNTYPPLRMRYFTAAHELWHLTDASQLQPADFDHERAADRFAAAIMLPKTLTLRLYDMFRSQSRYSEEQALLAIADMAGTPYKAVERRLKELGKRLKMEHSELKWKELRSLHGFSQSPLDLSLPETQFKEYVEVVKEKVAEGLDPLTAANKISYFAPDEAKMLQESAVNYETD